MVLDSQGYIFGAFVAESWKLDKHYFGNGETFLFRMHPSFEVYGWSRNNTHFVLGSNDCVAFGGGEQVLLSPLETFMCSRSRGPLPHLPWPCARTSLTALWSCEPAPAPALAFNNLDVLHQRCHSLHCISTHPSSTAVLTAR